MATVKKYGTLPAEYAAEPLKRGDAKFTVRSHVLAEVVRNPMRWLMGYESPESKAKEFGEVLDCLALTPTQWPKRFCMLPEDAPRRPSDRQRNAKKPSPETLASIEWWDDFNDRTSGASIITNELNATVHGALQRLKDNGKIAAFLGSGMTQAWVVGYYRDPETGLEVPTKALIDIVPKAEDPIFGEMLGDLKSTRNAEPRQFAKDCFRYRYHMQAAWYLDHWNAATGESRNQFLHVVVENFAPFECRMPLLSQRFIDHGRLLYQAALALYCKCLSLNRWPSYDPLGKEWPITDGEDYMFGMEEVYGESRFPVPPEESDENEAQEPEFQETVP